MSPVATLSLSPLNEHGHCSVFSIASSDDEVKDLLLLRRIRMLSWLQPMHLDLALNLESVEVQGLVSRGREGD